jgi:DNA end-binding protein Ku
MAMRALWKGHLRLSLVTIAVRVYPATDAAGSIRFNQLHRKCQTRIVYKKWCPQCDREVSADEIVKGYEFERGQYVALDEADIKRVRPESTRIVQLQQVTSAGAIDPLLLEDAYFLAPDGKPAAESFAVMRDALEGKAAIGTVAFHGRDRLVAVEPREAGMVMFTLRHEDDVRDIGKIPELDAVPDKARPQEIALAKRVLAEYEGEIDFSKYRDTYEDALRQMIDAKIAGEEIVAAKTEAPPRVVNLMDALRKSLDQVSRDRKKPARAKPAAKSRVTKFPARGRRRATA